MKKIKIVFSDLTARIGAPDDDKHKDDPKKRGK